MLKQFAENNSQGGVVARSGVASRLRPEDGSRAAATRGALVEAAVETLRTEGFAGASARSIAARAGCNQALVFYHFGTVTSLLLAALDSVSGARLERYGASVAGSGSLAELADVASGIIATDLDSGDAAVLVEMIAGSSATPGLGEEVAKRITPWEDFARDAIERALGASPLGSLVTAAELAHGVVALFLGLELLSHLDGDRSRAVALFQRARSLARLVDALNPKPGSER
jgi:AcrR family transcriptional regulator